MKSIIALLLLFNNFAFCQEAGKAEPEGKQYSQWHISGIYATKNSLSWDSDLFAIDIKQNDDHLTLATVRLSSTKLEYMANPQQKPGGPLLQVAAWPKTKHTCYYDLNGSGEFNVVLKVGYHNPKDPEDVQEYIIYNNAMIETQYEHTMTGVQSQTTFKALTGEVYKITPDGWVRTK